VAERARWIPRRCRLVNQNQLFGLTADVNPGSGIGPLVFFAITVLTIETIGNLRRSRNCPHCDGACGNRDVAAKKDV